MNSGLKPAEVIKDAIRALQVGDTGRVIVVALDGHSGAGKTTLATTIAETLDAAVLHGDDFYRDMPDDDRAQLSPAQGVDQYFDWQRLGTEALTKLVRRERAQFRPFNWTVGSGLTDAAVNVVPSDIVVVEGVYCARPEFDDLIDLKVLVEVAQGERETRRALRPRTVSRDEPQAWDTRWDAAERLYFKSIRPRDAFDIIVSGIG